MITKPYIGITGPVTGKEVKDIVEEFSNAGYSLSSGHIPMLGFLVSQKTLFGQTVQNRRYPSFKEIPELISTTEGKVFPMIHYNSKSIQGLASEVEKVFKDLYFNDLCKSVQLNIPWPEVGQLERMQMVMPDLKIVLQLSHKAMENKSPVEIAKRVKNYGSLIDYVLIDPSGGRGLEFDIDTSIEVYNQIKDTAFADLTIGFAGGFTGDNVQTRVDELYRRTYGSSNFSIDAEGGLRDKLSEEYGDDLLNMHKVRSYLQEASKVLP